MRLYSTIQSTEAGDVTLLAMFETFLAIGISISIYIKYHIATHLFIGAIVAPFLMLRTEESTKLGIRYFFNVFDYILNIGRASAARFPRSKAWNIFILGWVVGLIAISHLFAPLIIKITLTIRNLFGNFLHSIRCMPNNWIKLVLAMDFAHPPELVPGIEGSEIGSRFIITWSVISKDFKKPRKSRLMIGAACYASFTYAPAWLYRISVKSTSLMYLPLIWVAHGLDVKVEKVDVILDEILSSQLSRIKRWYACLVLLSMTIPWTILAYSQKLKGLIQNQHLTLYFFPVIEFNSWHITRGCAAMITIFLFFHADKMKIWNRAGETSGNERNLALISALQRIQSLCSFWTIGCGIYILYASVDWSTLPHIRWLPF